MRHFKGKNADAIATWGTTSDQVGDRRYDTKKAQDTHAVTLRVLAWDKLTIW
jgi:hypothetical protein